MKRFVSAVCTIICLGLLSTTTMAVPRTAFVHLFEWQWNDVANECENFLGPKGFSAIQVSPPQKSITGSAWWTRYQPVSYSIEGRSGTRAQFADMVNRCNAVGVEIYVDAVINHMAAWDRNFPEVPFGIDDFHTCTGGIDYSSAWSIQNCDLVSLNDLKTESDYVRGKIADYLNDLISLGVSGFRIDAAKHMVNSDIENIVSRLNGNPYIYQEVIDSGNEPISKNDYTYIGDVTEFAYTNTLGHYFKGRSPLNEISNIGTWGGWLSSDDAITFVANHDNQRQDTDNIITYKDGANLNELAHVFLLGWPYGYPKVMSSYAWDGHDQGPPSTGASSCSNGWLCEHRIRSIANMVAFRNNTADAFLVSDYWDNGNNQMAWGRGGLGFVVLNREDNSTLNQTLQTGMAAATYCDIIHADFNFATGECSGATVTVNGSGTATFSIATHDATAIHVGAVVGVPCVTCGGNTSNDDNGDGDSGDDDSTVSNIDFTCYQGETYSGQSVYVVGDQAALGNWDPANAYKLDSVSYPTWSSTISLPNNIDVQWKCLKREDSNVTAGVEWQAGENNQFNTGVSSSVSASFDSSVIDDPVEEPTVATVHFSCYNGDTNTGQSVYAVGSIAELGSWDPANAVILDPSSYPTWQADITLPVNTAVEWKCVKREESNPSVVIEWQGGSNNSFNSGTGATTEGSF